MNTLEWTTLVFGLLVRLAIPLGATLFGVWFLRRLDIRWQTEALKRTAVMGGANIPIAQLHCWDVHDCPPERKTNCPAYLDANVACWETHCCNGQMQEACQTCAFRKTKLIALSAVS